MSDETKDETTDATGEAPTKSGQKVVRRPAGQEPMPTSADAQRANFRLRGNRKAWHHLFISDVGKHMKNVSIKKGAPDIRLMDHKHIFHTHNSSLVPQQYCSTTGGHFHEIEWGIDKNGQPYIKRCGPPLTYRYVSKPSGQKKVKGAVQWRDRESDDDEGGEPKMIVDRHTHVFEYQYSEELGERGGRVSPEVANAPNETAEAQALGMRM